MSDPYGQPAWKGWVKETATALVTSIEATELVLEPFVPHPGDRIELARLLMDAAYDIEEKSYDAGLSDGIRDNPK